MKNFPNEFIDFGAITHLSHLPCDWVAKLIQVDTPDLTAISSCMSNPCTQVDRKVGEL